MTEIFYLVPFDIRSYCSNVKLLQFIKVNTIKEAIEAFKEIENCKITFKRFDKIEKRILNYSNEDLIIYKCVGFRNSENEDSKIGNSENEGFEIYRTDNNLNLMEYFKDCCDFDENHGYFCLLMDLDCEKYLPTFHDKVIYIDEYNDYLFDEYAVVLNTN